MRRKLGKSLRKHVLAEFKEKLPMLRHIRSGWGVGELFFKWQNKSGPRCFVCLFVDDKWYDDFTFKVAWSEDDKFPIGLQQKLHYEPKNGAKLFTISDLWQDPMSREYRQEEHWWHLGKVIPDERALDFSAYMEPDPPVEDSIAKVPEAVAEAISKIEEYVLPYFERIAVQHQYVEKILRPTIGGALRKQVLTQFKEKLPMFRQIPKSTDASWDILLFEWQNKSGPRCFVRLRVGYQVHKFTFDVAWSEDGNFPNKLSQTIKCAPRDGAKLFQISDFWMDPRDIEGYWWHLGELIPPDKAMEYSPSMEPDPAIEDSIARIPETVADAIAKIMEYVIPYFEKITEQHTITAVPKN